ncbi:hypothetical protein DDZ18_01895 [Marinicauda salina]|uniref:Uncharacterized protein n=1 Tax=Marinicauda salina TaxID=2135793 RepID=A0A2U2BWK4_9PROT|nr:hypothetical protein [Marinicauda salina]PWE18382.1 hypothetical protein DDZ18_01895 [Marinicauda salina]
MVYGVKSEGYGRNAGKRWRRDDIADLKALARKGAPVRVISLKLGRPDSAVKAKAAELGLSVSAEPVRVAPGPRRTLRRSPAAPPTAARDGQLELFQ